MQELLDYYRRQGAPGDQTALVGLLREIQGEYGAVPKWAVAQAAAYYRIKESFLLAVIRRIPGEKDVKIWRPIVPLYAQDNMPVYWHEGTYTAHTGGWHCDEVMLVEYDD